MQFITGLVFYSILRNHSLIPSVILIIITIIPLFIISSIVLFTLYNRLLFPVAYIEEPANYFQDIPLSWKEKCQLKEINIISKDVKNITLEKMNLIVIKTRSGQKLLDMKTCELSNVQLSENSNTIPLSGISWQKSKNYKTPNYVQWDVPMGKGKHLTPKGYKITDIAVDPERRYIAVVIKGLYGGHNFFESVLYILHIIDGKKICSHHFNNHNHIGIAFDSEHFVYSYLEKESPHSNAVNSTITVFKVPE